MTKTYVKIGRDGAWTSENDVDIIGIRMSSPAFRVFRRCHAANPAMAILRQDLVRQTISQEIYEMLRSAPDVQTSEIIPEPLRRMVLRYRMNMPDNLDSGDTVRIDRIANTYPELQHYVGQYAMVAAVLPEKLAPGWRVLLILPGEPFRELELPYNDIALSFADFVWPDDTTAAESTRKNDSHD